MIKVIYNKTCGRCVQSEPLTSGMVGQTIHFEYSHDFDGLTLTAVFTNGKTTVDVLNPGNQCVIPHEVLDTVGALVNVGIYATKGNELVIPTIYATIGIVLKGADPSGDASADPTLPVWAQTQAMIGNLNDLTTQAKNNLVAAINEAAQSGGSGSTVELDTTLTQSGKAADAKAVGDALAGKQNTISDLEAIRTGAAKGATALQSVPSTYRTASEQDTIDDGKVDKVTGKGLSSNDYTDAAKAKVDALAPVATSGSYNDLTNKPTIPTALPNPNALTFTGAVTGSYDGSAPLTVNIPEGGGGTGGGSSGTWELIGEVTSDGAGTNTGISIPCDISGYKSVFVYAQNLPSDTNFRIVMRPQLTWSSITCYFGYNLLGKHGSFSFGAQNGKMNNQWSITGLAYNIANRIFAYGAAEAQYNGGSAMWRQSEQGNKLPTESWNNIKYISLDRNSSTDIVPEGCILRAWGCK